MLYLHAGDWAETYDVYVHYGKVRCHLQVYLTEDRHPENSPPKFLFGLVSHPLSFVSEL